MIQCLETAQRPSCERQDPSALSSCFRVFVFCQAPGAMTIFTKQIISGMKLTSFSILIMYYSCFFFFLEQRIIVGGCSANISLLSYCRQKKEIKWHGAGKLIKVSFQNKSEEGNSTN